MLLKKRELAEAVQAKMKDLDLASQPALVAWLRTKGCQVHQTTISRLLSLEIKEDTHRVKEICRYADIDLRKYVVRTSPKKSNVLMGALESVWDGSRAHERWLARMIKTAGAAPPVY